MPFTEKVAPRESCRAGETNAISRLNNPTFELPQFVIHYNTGYQRGAFPCPAAKENAIPKLQESVVFLTPMENR